MPIRINLLAEAKAAEELRRHDPVKRVIFVGALAVALTLVWSSSLQLETMLAKKKCRTGKRRLRRAPMSFNTCCWTRKKSPPQMKS
jgi:hypothetical protein